MKYTAEQMELVVNEWQTSGLSKKEFCRQRNITYQTFHYWLKRIKQAHPKGFAEVKVVDDDQINGCEVTFPSGARMVFRGELSASWLRDVLY